ncbi:glycosyltransferase family 9 protein [Veillonella agrestimuris]|uniref:glycosyltransferase family 9 protein n=1 Tax=Veillonella agrestimuris TaxID=2941340 RepID=UPI00204016DD|nr:glycosyltransferase family 9 protein [Veillonella agrestimuris]
MNILFVRLSYIGDILHATAAARWIKEQYPAAKLHWIVTPSMAELLENNPYVDVIIPWQRDLYEAHSKKLHLRTMWKMWWELRDQLQPYHFDIAVDVQGRLITGLVLLASEAPIRLGLGGTKELNWLFTNYKSKDRKSHVITQYLEVAQLLSMALGGAIQERELSLNGVVSETTMDLFLTKEERMTAVDAIATALPESEKKRIGLVLGSSWATKEWPQYKWLELMELLQGNAQFICFGGPKEAEEHAEQMEYIERSRLEVYNRLGTTTLREMAALMDCCDIIVACDTGALHIALALGKPVVALFGPTDPKLWGPLDGRFRIIVNDNMDCLGCRKRKCPKGEPYCMTRIDAATVKAAIVELLDKGE